MRLPLPAVPIAAALGALLALLVFALPQLDRPFWHDEIATLEMFAASGPLHPFTDYRLPNNHPLSSAVLAVMRGVSETPDWLRLWPLASSLCACVLLVRLAWRLGGGPAAWIAGLAFASSGITQAFALQLRGYAPSWPWLLLAAMAVLGHGQGRWRGASAMGVFALASLFALALLPSNLPWLMVLATIACAMDGQRHGLRPISFLWLLLPAAGLLAYVGMFEALQEASRQSWGNPENRWQLLATILGDQAQDLLLLLPLAAGSLLLAWRARNDGRIGVRQTGDQDGPGLREAWWPLAILSAPVLFWLLAPMPPFTRAVVPWWPLTILAVAVPAAAALQALPSRWRQGLLFALAAALLVNAYARENYGWRPWAPRQASEAMPQTLLLHYYRDGYRPDLAADLLVDWLRDPRALAWSDHSDFPSLRWHLRERDASLPPRLSHAPDLEPALRRAQFEHRPLLLVVASERQACDLLASAGVTCTGRLAPVADTGYFKAFRVRNGQ